MPTLSLDAILEKAHGEETLSREEIRFLLSLGESQAIEEVFSVARDLRRRYFGDHIFLYGFVYFSTYCGNRCAFCLYRTGNKYFEHYRKTLGEVLEIAHGLADSGVHLIDLTMGEDPLYHKNGFEPVVDMIRQVKKNTGLPVMISPGVVPHGVLKEIAEAGADWYACYQETHNRDLFARLRWGQDYDERMAGKYEAMKSGLLVEEGILTGVGDSLDDVVGSVETMAALGSHQVRVMGFVPQKGTPMKDQASPSYTRETSIIAVLRLVFPDRLIPASLDVEGISGLRQRLEAGANVVTSLIPPYSGLAGVSQHCLDIDEGNRTVQGVHTFLEDLGLLPAGREQYADWVEREREILKSQGARAG